MKRLTLFAFLLSGKLALAAPEGVTTWHLVFGAGEAPNRILITADPKIQQLPDGTSRLRVIEQFENHPQNVDFYVFTMDFNTQSKELRTYKAYRIFKDGRLETEEKPSNWMAVPNNWMRICYEICANPNYFKEHKDTAPALGKMCRPVDVVDLNRRILWEFKPPK
ncbi:hypothetical protein JST97_09390 [bacterium]|nr:hypothetical protein [bacterium]